MTQAPINSEITSDDRLWAALGYPIGIIALIMLFIQGKKDRPFIKFHAVQALALTVILIVIEIVVNILQAVFRHVSLGICGLVGCFLPILWLLLFWPGILAFQGKYFDIPFVTKFLRGQHWIV
jgi:uncharacterized membrane protein